MGEEKEDCLGRKQKLYSRPAVDPAGTDAVTATAANKVIAAATSHTSAAGPTMEAATADLPTVAAYSRAAPVRWMRTAAKKEAVEAEGVVKSPSLPAPPAKCKRQHQ
jgi:hypothetical protein